MNIFVLDDDVDQCARFHCDQHVGKMVLESAQILCTALNLRGVKTPYRSTHVHHPCVHWAGKSYDNFLWLMALSEALNREFCWRYHRAQDHASMVVLREIQTQPFESLGLTPFVQAMPEQYKKPDDAVGAYRSFYCGEKAQFATWRRRTAPPWYVPSGEAVKP